MEPNFYYKKPPTLLNFNKINSYKLFKLIEAFEVLY